MDHRDIIVIGASAGGTEALKTLVAGLPADLPAAVLIVLHTAPSSPFLLPAILNQRGALLAVATQDHMTVQNGRIYVAPPDHHLLLSPGHVHVTKGPKENLSRPAVDPLFRTAARFYGRRVIGVVLTGNLNDGTVGLVEIKRRGGLAIVQDPKEAPYPSMPSSALRFAAVDHCVGIEALAPLLVRLTHEELAPEKDPPPVSAQLVMESKFPALGILDEVERMDTIGTLAPYSCPECHGPLWRISGDGPLRFRCHTGHALSAESLGTGQADNCEFALWDTLRVLEERAALLREMAGRAREQGPSRQAASWEDASRRLEKDMEAVRRMLAAGRADEKPPVAPRLD